MSKKQMKVVIISGGALTQIRPHLALCVPAYGTIGNDISGVFQQISTDLEIVNVHTKMAGGDLIETNADLDDAITDYLKDPDVKCIVVAAGVCDFDVVEIITDETDEINTSIGKQYDRLQSDLPITLRLEPSNKIINRVKKERPDVLLVSFKTTSDVSLDELKLKCIKNQQTSQSDIVFGNDIINRYNGILIAKTQKFVATPTRMDAVRTLVINIIKGLTQ